MAESRRDFLKRMTRGAAYAAPLMVTLSTPDGLLGQGQSTNSQKGGMGKGMQNNCPPGQANMGACSPVVPQGSGIGDIRSRPGAPPTSSSPAPGTGGVWPLGPGGSDR
jgi:hypothetical protein